MITALKQVQTEKNSMQFTSSTFAFPVCVPKNILILSDLAALLLLVSESPTDDMALTALFPCQTNGTLLRYSLSDKTKTCER